MLYYEMIPHKNLLSVKDFVPQKGDFYMKKLLAVIDMQNDFIDGSLGTHEAAEITDRVAAKIAGFEGEVIFTLDTHTDNYPDTQEGRLLPVMHCIKGTRGHELAPKLKPLSQNRRIFEKPAFGSVELGKYVSDGGFDEVCLIGLCTDICVISNAMLIKAFAPETKVSVDSSCCAGTTKQNHENALSAMKMCQIEII